MGASVSAGLDDLGGEQFWVREQCLVSAGHRHDAGKAQPGAEAWVPCVLAVGHGDVLGAVLESLAVDCCVDRVVELMDGFSASAWQRAAYLLDRGRMSEKAKEFMARRPSPEMPAARLGDGPTSVWSNEFGVNDLLVAPLQDRLGKS